MYVEHFGLKEIPFSIAPDPRYIFMSEGHREALAHLLYGMDGEGGFVLLTGEVGTGKTTICRCLLEKVPQNVEIAFVLHPTLSAEELLATICDEFRIAYPDGKRSIKVFVDRINSYLLEAHAAGKKSVLIIEEAQNLGPEVLEQLRLLTNLETSRRKLLQIILLGQPELRDKLARPELLQVAQRITVRYHLGPLSKAEVKAYVTHRLSVAGCKLQLFPPSVTADICRMTGGIPRVINVLCDRALLGSFVEGKSEVDRTTLARAAREALGKKVSWIRSRFFVWAAVGFVFVALAVSTFAFRRSETLSPGREVGTSLSEKGGGGDAWQQKADYFPLIFLDSSYGRAARQDHVDFGNLRDEMSEERGPQEIKWRAFGPGVKRSTNGLNVHADNEDQPDGAEMRTKTEEKGTGDVIHP